MDPMTPASPASAMSHGGTFMRPGVIGWAPRTPEAPEPEAGPAAQASPAASWEPATPATIEHALAAAVKDPDRVTELLDELSRGRLWLPLPEDSPVTDGTAVRLPTVTYLGEEFVPAFASARRLAHWYGPFGSEGPDGPFADMPHVVVPAAGLARRLPDGLGIALNPGAEASVPIYPGGVSYLAADLVTANGIPVRVGRPPSEPVILLGELRAALEPIPDVRRARRAWLWAPGQREGLLISVTLRDSAVQNAVLDAIQRAAGAVCEPGFPIDVTFPSEAEPDELDEWISAHAEPFYLRD